MAQKDISILVVDDDSSNFDVIEAILSEQNYLLNYSASGRDAINSLDVYNPDVILLDVMMPDLDGLEVCKKIRKIQKWQFVPIIMVTALDSKSDLARCLMTGANDFISKPINATELKARVYSMVRIKQQYDKIQALSHLQQETINILQNSLQQLQNSLISTLSHELNTPLNGIIGSLQLLKYELSQSNIETVEWAEISARRLEKLIKKLLLYSKIEIALTVNPNDNNHQLEPTIFPKNEITLRMIHLAQRVQRKNDLVIKLKSAKVKIKQEYLWIIFDELLDNALKFSEPQTPILITSKIAGKMFNICVSDSGRGMTVEQIACIGAFMQFERKTYEQQGLGMGLKLVKKIAESVSGKLEINSVYQQSTTVTVNLPIAGG